MNQTIRQEMSLDKLSMECNKIIKINFQEALKIVKCEGSEASVQLKENHQPRLKSAKVWPSREFKHKLKRAVFSRLNQIRKKNH